MTEPERSPYRLLRALRETLIVRHKNMKKTSIAIGIIPSLIALSLFYTLAMHMYVRLNGWPDSIGMRDFPLSLKTHAGISMIFFWALLMITLFISPVVILVCGLIKNGESTSQFGS